jgi:hypothetical protein
MKIRRITRKINPSNMSHYDMLEKWIGERRNLLCVIETSIWVTVFGVNVYRLYNYWVVRYIAYLHNPNPSSIYPEYNIPVVKWQWMDKDWIKHFSDISYRIRKARQGIYG